MSSQQTDPTKPAIDCNKNRAQLKHVLQDVGMKDKPKMLDLEAEHGPLARLLFIDLISAMSAASLARVSRNVAKVLGKRIGLSPEKTNEIIEYCLSNQMLLTEEGQLTNSRVIEDQEKCWKEQERWRNAKRIPKEPKEIPAGTTVEQARKSEELKIEELNNELKKNGQKKVLDFLWFDDIQIEQWQGKLGKAGFQRACEKLNGWIGQTRGTAEFYERLDKGKNASFVLQNWGSQEFEIEKAKLERARGSPNGNQPKHVSASQSQHPALVAQRKREVSEGEGNILDKLGLRK